MEGGVRDGPEQQRAGEGGERSTQLAGGRRPEVDLPATISTTALGSFTRFILAARTGAMTAVTVMISSPFKPAELMGHTP